MSTNKSLSNIYKKVKLLSIHNPRRGVNILTTEGSADILVAFLLTENTVMYVQKFTNRLTAPADSTRNYCIDDHNTPQEIILYLLDTINNSAECLDRYDHHILRLYNDASGPINLIDCAQFGIGISHDLLRNLINNLKVCKYPQPDHQGVPFHQVPLLIYIAEQLKAGSVKHNNAGFRINPHGYVTFQDHDDVLVIQSTMYQTDKHDGYYCGLDRIVSNLGVL